MTVQVLHKKFTSDQYQQMIQSGILTDCDRVELISGEILEMSPVGRQHAACVDRLTELFILSLSTQAMVRNQNPIRLENNSEPQPDLVILKRRDDFYSGRHPISEDVLALIEVSDTTIEFDRTVKLPLYAQARIAEVWIIDINSQIIEVYRDPSGDFYQEIQRFSRGDSVTFQFLTNQTFTADQIFG